MDSDRFNRNGSENLPVYPIIAQHYPEGSMCIGTESDFAASIQQLFSQIRPTKIIETGTYIGTGTTTIIAEAIRQLGLDADFYTIEVNPENFKRAKQYLREQDYQVACLNGLSVPREMLPSLAQIRKSTVTDIEQGGVVFVDHDPDVRAEWYFHETHFPDVPDSLLHMVMMCFDFKPDFVLLDSGGHIGNIEFFQHEAKVKLVDLQRRGQRDCFTFRLHAETAIQGSATDACLERIHIETAAIKEHVHNKIFECQFRQKQPFYVDFNVGISLLEGCNLKRFVWENLVLLGRCFINFFFRSL